jgi:hypothetical protein
MENRRDDLVVILAGYADRMNRFFSSNPGFRSRIAHPVAFPDCRPDELRAIAELMLREQNYRFSPEAAAAFRNYIERRMTRPHFANGHSVSNALGRVRLRQATRPFEIIDRSLTVDDQQTIEAPEILASRVFSCGIEGTAAEPGT